MGQQADDQVQQGQTPKTKKEQRQEARSNNAETKAAGKGQAARAQRTESAGQENTSATATDQTNGAQNNLGKGRRNQRNADANANAAGNANAGRKGNAKNEAATGGATDATASPSGTDVNASATTNTNVNGKNRGAQNRANRNNRNGAKGANTNATTGVNANPAASASPSSAAVGAATTTASPATSPAGANAQTNVNAQTNTVNGQANATAPRRGKGSAQAWKSNPEKVQTVKQQYSSFRAQPRPDRVPAVTFNQSHRIEGSDRWQGEQYVAFRSYHPEQHDRNWYHQHYQRVELIGGGYYYMNNGYWYPAWGYSPSEQYYAYDGPIYVGHRSEPPDQVIADVQASLQEMGYYTGEVDGLLGPLTRQALTAYQEDNGLYTTAAIDEPTLDSLGMNS